MWIQDPKTPGPFSSDNIKWTQNVAYIPYARLKDFIAGESNGPQNPTIFIPRKRYIRIPGSLSASDPETYLEHIYYHCAFGGTDSTGKDKNVTSLFVMRKKESSDRGCLCGFEVKRLYLHPHVAKITYESTSHVDVNGFPCHERLNASCIIKAPIQIVHISPALREWVISRLEHKFTPQQIINEHRELVQNGVRQGGAIAAHTNGGYLCDVDISKISEAFLKGRVALQKLDEHAVLMWSKRYKHKVFFYEQHSVANDRNQADAASFVIGIQTTWQKRKLLAGQETIVMCETTYGSKKLQYQMFSILVVDQSYNGIPVAWIITPNIKKHNAQPWMEALRQSMYELSIDWRPVSFVVENLSSSTKEIRSIPDDYVELPSYGHEPAKVRSTSKPYVEYLVYNGHHEWACCTCAWSRMGDLCKHVVKVAEMYSPRNGDKDSHKSATTVANSRKLPTLSMHMANLQAARGESLSINSPSNPYYQQSDDMSSDCSSPHDDANLAYPESMVIMNSIRELEGTSVVELHKDLTYQEAELHNFLSENPALVDKYLNSFQELKNKFIEENQGPIHLESSDETV